MARAARLAGVHRATVYRWLADAAFASAARMAVEIADVVDLLDPHALHLEESRAKATGLAQFAAKHYPAFGPASI